VSVASDWPARRGIVTFFDELGSGQYLPVNKTSGNPDFEPPKERKTEADCCPEYAGGG